MRRIIGLTGVAKSGKDTLFEILKERLSLNFNINIERASLADALKREIKDFCVKEYGINPLNCNPEEKEIIRPYLVFYGNFQRFKSNGSYWWKKLQPLTQEETKNWLIVTDIRYCQYEQDDYYFISKNNGTLIHLSREDKDGNLIKPANQQEEIYDPRMKCLSDIHFKWKTSPKEELESQVDKLISLLTEPNK